jgi:hypothetical protein
LTPEEKQWHEEWIARLRTDPDTRGIYIASRSKHAPKWRVLRDDGVPILSSWIDEAGPGETVSWTFLWDKCITESTCAAVFILYREEGEVLRGAYLEMGAALANGVPVIYVGPDDGNVAKNQRLYRAESIEDALAIAKRWL